MALGYNEFKGVFSAPPSLAPTLFKLDILGALHSGFVHVILVFVLVEVFDATGTLVGVAKRAGLVPEDRPNRLGRALFADSSAIVAGSMLGTSSTTAYVKAPGRAGRRPHRPDRAGGGRAVPGRAVHLAAGWRRAGLRHRARPALTWLA